MGPRACLDGRKISSPPGFDPGPSVLYMLTQANGGSIRRQQIGLTQTAHETKYFVCGKFLYLNIPSYTNIL